MILNDLKCILTVQFLLVHYLLGEWFPWSFKKLQKLRFSDLEIS